jgi:hypothetical protein
MPKVAKVFYLEAILAPNRRRLVAGKADLLYCYPVPAGSALLSIKELCV